MNQAEIQKWVGSDYRRLISLTVEGNPTGTYQLIKAKWPREIPDYAPGYEKVLFNRNSMAALLQDKASQTANPMQFAATIAQTVKAANVQAMADYIRLNP